MSDAVWCVYMRMSVCGHVYVCVYMYECVCVCVCVCMYVCVCACVNVCVCVQDVGANIAVWPQLTVLYTHTTVLALTACNSVTEVCVDSWQLISVTMFAWVSFFHSGVWAGFLLLLFCVGFFHLSFSVRLLFL